MFKLLKFSYSTAREMKIRLFHNASYPQAAKYNCIMKQRNPIMVNEYFIYFQVRDNFQINTTLVLFKLRR